MKMKVLILTGDGVNCERETALSFRQAGFDSVIMHINDMLAEPELLHEYHALAFPGGFSFGDDLGCGKIMAHKIKKIMKQEIDKFLDDRKPIIGICNGFQVLAALGFFNDDRAAVTLEHNDSGHYINRWEVVHCRPRQNSIWTKDISNMRLPIRHGEGRLTFSKTIGDKEQQLNYLLDNGRVAFTYENNPNGSDGKIAGVTDSTGLILGLMPHPEAARSTWLYPDHHVDTQESLGQKIFENAASYIEEHIL